MKIIRILLDTCVIRNLMHAIGPKLDLNAVSHRLSKYRISVPDTAFAELTRQLVEKRLPFEDWRVHIHDLDSILDPKWPVFVGGRELAALAGLQTDLAIEVKDSQLYHQAIWRWLSGIADEENMLAEVRFTTADGSRMSFTPDPAHISAILTKEVDSWICYVKKMQRYQRKIPDAFSTLAKTKALIQSGLGKDPNDPPDLATRLDGVVSVQAELLQTSFSATMPYNPKSKKRRGDLFDLSLLYALPVPAVVVTADEPFLGRLRRSGSSDAAQVISTDEFNKHARNDTLDTLLAHHNVAQTQEQRWQEAAYFHWLNRGQPIGDSLKDWLETEPVA